MTDTHTALEAGASVPSMPPRENLIRATTDIGLTRSEGSEMPTLTGHFAVWDTWTEIRSAYEGNFLERFAPGSMTKTLGENTPKVLFQHGRDPQIGDKVLGRAARVEPDATGAFYEVPLLDTSYNRDLIPGLEAGLYGASFRFSVMQEDVAQKPKRSADNPRGLPERTVLEAKVMEFGPVTFPAYAAATAGVRSLTDEFQALSLLENEDMLERLAILISERAKPAPFTVSFSGTPGLLSSGSGVNYITDMVDVSPKRDTSLEPESSEAATPESPGIEPEPSEATTHSDRGRFWFAKTPDHLKE